MALARILQETGLGAALPPPGSCTEADQTHCPRPLPFSTCPKPDKGVTVRRPHPVPLAPSPSRPGACLSVPSIALHRAWHAGGLRRVTPGPPGQVGVCVGEKSDPGVKTSVIITAPLWGTFTCSPGSVLSLAEMSPHRPSRGTDPIHTP